MTMIATIFFFATLVISPTERAVHAQSAPSDCNICGENNMIQFPTGVVEFVYEDEPLKNNCQQWQKKVSNTNAISDDFCRHEILRYTYQVCRCTQPNGEPVVWMPPTVSPAPTDLVGTVVLDSTVVTAPAPIYAPTGAPVAAAPVPTASVVDFVEGVRAPTAPGMESAESPAASPTAVVVDGEPTTVASAASGDGSETTERCLQDGGTKENCDDDDSEEDDTSAAYSRLAMPRAFFQWSLALVATLSVQSLFY